MKELVVISGKGGTGKTSLMAAFASLTENKALCDADVDAADLHLIMEPYIKERHDFQGGHTASINLDNCTECGVCRDLCRWDAISENFVVDGIECEGCGVCVYFCPENTIEFPITTCGEWFISDTRFGTMVHARLGIAEENSGKLVSIIRNEVRKVAEKHNLNLIITDGPPGIGCPVIASIGGANAILIVSEPTVSGLHDMERVAKLAAHFKVPAMLCVNKYDLNLEQTQALEALAEKNNIAVLGRVPFDPIFVKAMIQGQTIIEYNNDSEAVLAVKRIWTKVVEKMNLVAIPMVF